MTNIKISKFLFVLLCFLPFFVLPAKAIESLSSHQQPIFFNNLDPEVVRIHSATKSISQDSQGFIWIATQDGVERYDGKNLVHFNSTLGSSNSLTSNWVNIVFTDSSGRVWISAEGGINLYLSKDEGFKQFSKQQGFNALDSTGYDLIAEENENSMWFSAMDGHLYNLNIEAQVFTKTIIPNDSNDKLQIISLDVDNDGVVWVATRFHGSFIIKNGVLQKLVVSPSDASNHYKVSRISAPSENSVWIVANGSLLQYSLQGGVIREIKPELHKKCLEDTTDLVIDESGGIWIGSGGYGLCFVDPLTSKFVQYKSDKSNINGLLDDRINDLYIDEGGVLWIATMGGVSSFNTRLQNFTHVSQEFGIGQAMKSNIVTSIAQANNNTVFVGSWGGGVTVFVPNENPYAILSERNSQEDVVDSRVMSLMVEGENKLWVGTFGAGLFKVTKQGRVIQRYYREQENEQALSSNAVSKIIRLIDGSIAIATYGGGINIISENNPTLHFEHDESDDASISSNYVLDLFERENGDIWVATKGGGLNLFNHKTHSFRRFEQNVVNDESLLSKNIFAVLEASGHLWLATQDAGIAKLDLNQVGNKTPVFTHFSSANGLENDVVYGLLDDNEGNIWLSHSMGISKMDIATNQFRHFDKSHGLQGRDFTAGAQHKGNDGRLFFGGSNGFNTFIPAKVLMNKHQAQLSLVSLKVMNKEVAIRKVLNTKDELVLKNDENSINVEFALLDFTRPALNTYEYKILGLSNTWLMLNNQNSIPLTNLQDGNYTLVIRARNADGFLVEDTLVLKVVVLPPIWRSNGAYLIYLLALMACIAGVIYRQYLINKKRKAYQVKLEKTVSERTAELEKINVKLASSISEIEEAKRKVEEAASAKSIFLATMSHEIRTPMNSILGMGELLLNTKLTKQQRQYASNAYRSGELLLEMINDVLDFSKMEVNKLHLENVSINIHEYVEETVFQLAIRAHEKSLSFGCIIMPSVPVYAFADSVRLRQILVNLISNAIKFTEQGAVQVTLGFTESNGFSIAVKDTGIGIPEKSISKIFNAFEQAESSTTRRFGGTGLGLNITKTLVEMMNGTINVESSLGEGSTFRAELPLRLDTDTPIKDILSEYANYTILHYANASFEQLTVQNIATRHNINYVHADSLRQDASTVKHDIILIDKSIIGNDIELLASFTQPVFVLTKSNDRLEDSFAQHNIIQLPLTSKSLYEAINNPVDTGAMCKDEYSPLQFGMRYRFSANILLVDDSKTNQEVALGILSNFGCDVDLAENGLMALQMCGNKRYDLVLMDHQMPVMDGITATSKIKLIDAHTRPTHIVALTADQSSNSRKKWREVNVDKVLLKPFKADELLSQLKSLLADKIIERNEQEKLLGRKNEASLTQLNQNLLDLATIENLQELSRSASSNVLKRLLNIFDEEMQESLPKMQEAIDACDLGELARITHALKSVSGNLGAKKLYELLADIESSALENRDKDYASLLQTVHKVLASSRAELENIANQLHD